MKLLEKSQLNTAKVKDVTREQAEGLKLAKRVDSLREIAAQEEASLTKFREKTLKQIKEEIEKVSKPLEALRLEVQYLQQSRQDALKPIDAEKADLQRIRDEMFKETKVLNEFREHTKLKEKQVSENLKETENEYQRANEFKKRHKQYLQDASVARTQAQGFLKDAAKIKQESEESVKALYQELAQRDMEMAAKERMLEMRVLQQDKRQAEQEELQILLNDQRGTLEREMKRMKVIKKL